VVQRGGEGVPKPWQVAESEVGDVEQVGIVVEEQTLHGRDGPEDEVEERER
jgi:hypothetical protein